MAFSYTAASVWRDFETDGVPASGTHKIRKAEIRALFAERDAVIEAGLTASGFAYLTREELYADLAHDANSQAWVVADSTTSYNGVYRKSGASGFGSWSRIADLPYSFIRAANAGTGTANAVQATATLPIPTGAYVALVSVNFAATNTGAMTLSINSETARDLVTNTGDPVPAGYVTAGMPALVTIDENGDYRFFNYGDAEAVQAAAEAALADLLDRYLGAFADDAAATAAAGGTPVSGQMYWNTTTPELRVYDGGWLSATNAAATITIYSTTADGTTVEYADLDGDAQSTNSFVFIDGRHVTSGFTLVDGTLTLDEAPSTGVPIAVYTFEIAPMGATTADLVSISDPDGNFGGAATVQEALEYTLNYVGSSSAQILRPANFSAAGDGTTDDKIALDALLTEANSTGLPIDWGSKTYVIGSALSKTFTRKPIWRGDGATIKLVSASPLERAVTLTVDEFGADIRGVGVNANLDAYDGLGIFNTNTGMAAADIGDLYLEDVFVRQAYRSGLLYGGGFGIRIHGGYRLAHLVRPVIEDCRLAEDAGIDGNIGIHGLTFTASATSEAKHVLIDDALVIDVKSEDTSYAYDQDGILVSGLESDFIDPNGSTCEINRAKVVNAGGRSIKIQRQSATINQPYFLKNAGGAKAGGRALMEIDFQRGSGRVTGGHARYEGYAVEDIVWVTMRNVDEQSVHINGLTWHVASGSVAPLRAVSRYGADAHGQASTVIENCAGNGLAIPTFIKYTTDRSTASYPAESLTVRGCGGLFSSEFVRVHGFSDPAVSVLATDCWNRASSVPLTVAEGGSTSISTTGSANNRGFS